MSTLLIKQSSFPCSITYAIGWKIEGGWVAVMFAHRSSDFMEDCSCFNTERYLRTTFLGNVHSDFYFSPSSDLCYVCYHSLVYILQINSFGLII